MCPFTGRLLDDPVKGPAIVLKDDYLDKDGKVKSGWRPEDVVQARLFDETDFAGKKFKQTKKLSNTVFHTFLGMCCEGYSVSKAVHRCISTC